MSDEKELMQKLDSALRNYGADYGFVITDKSVKKLLSGSVYETVEAEGCTPKRLAEAFMEVGKVIEQSNDGAECVAVIGAGMANMNIALIVSKIDNGKIEIIATANEGLIKQNTAKQAINKLGESIVTKCSN